MLSWLDGILIIVGIRSSYAYLGLAIQASRAQHQQISLA